MANENCLEGMACPKCKGEEPFKIVVTTWMVVYDNGTDEHEDTEWDDDSPCVCVECGYAGKVKDFQIQNQRPRRRSRCARQIHRSCTGSRTQLENAVNV